MMHAMHDETFVHPQLPRDMPDRFLDNWVLGARAELKLALPNTRHALVDCRCPSGGTNVGNTAPCRPVSLPLGARAA
jgi:hypothetical protein